MTIFTFFAEAIKREYLGDKEIKKKKKQLLDQTQRYLLRIITVK